MVENWLGTVERITYSLFPTELVTLNIGVTYNDEKMSPTVLDLTIDNEKLVKQWMQNASKGLKDVFIFWSTVIEIRPYGKGIKSDLNKRVLGTMTYYSYESVETMIANKTRFLLRNAPPSDGTNLPATKYAIVFKDNKVATNENMIAHLGNEPMKAYLLPTQSSYSNLTAMVMQQFRYPDLLEDGQHINPDNIQDTMHETSVNHRLAALLESEYTKVSAKMENKGSKEGQLWMRHVDAVANELDLRARRTPRLRGFNKAHRRLFIDPILLHVCELIDSYYLVDAMLCTDQTSPPPEYVGTGPVDYTFGGSCGGILLSAPAPEDEDWQEPQVEDEDEEDEEQFVYEASGSNSEVCERKIQPDSLYQAVGAGHDLLLVKDAIEVHNSAVLFAKNPAGGKRPYDSSCQRGHPSKLTALEAEAGQGPTSRPADSTEPTRRQSGAFDPRPPFENPGVAVILSTARTWRLYAILAPTVTQSTTKPALYYGGELLLPVLKCHDSVEEIGGPSGAAANQEGVDRALLLRIMCMLALAGSGAFVRCLAEK